MPLPEARPSESLLAVVLQDFDRGLATSRRERLGGEERFLDDWLMALEAAAVAQLRERQVGLVTVAVGLERDADGDQSLAACAFVHPAALGEAGEVSWLAVPTEDGGAAEMRMTVAPWEPRPHSDLRYGTLACWVHLEDGRHAALTARHNVIEGDWFPSYAELDDGSLAGLLWHSPNCLDASVLAVGAEPDFAWLALDRASPVRPAVTVRTKEGEAAREVVYVNNTFGSLTSRTPHLFWLDSPLYPGDSGSLVESAADGSALGMYIAEVQTPAFGPMGLCQGLEQLNALFGSNWNVQGLCRRVEAGH